MILSFLTQSILDITSGVICWTIKTSYNTIYYFIYKNEKEYVKITKEEYEKIKNELELKKYKIIELEKLIK